MSKPDSPVAANRRRLFAGAATAGAAATAVALLPKTPAAPVAAAPQAAAPEGGGGYQVTEHVLRYYRSTRV